MDDTPDDATELNATAAPEVYGVPRRFDMVTLLVVSVAFAMLFAFLRLLGASPTVSAMVLTFVAVIGIAQAVLFGGRYPRAASVIVGAIAGPTLTAIDSISVGYQPSTEQWLTPSFFTTPLGYLFGAVIGGVFLVADRLKNRYR